MYAVVVSLSAHTALRCTSMTRRTPTGPLMVSASVGGVRPRLSVATKLAYHPWRPLDKLRSVVFDKAA